MPLYLVEMAAATEPRGDLAFELVAQRYPEVSIEHRYAEHDGARRTVWVCRAPTRDHLQRWSAAAGLALIDIRHVHAVSAGPNGRTTPQERS